jgi:hypothetical protein
MMEHTMLQVALAFQAIESVEASPAMFPETTVGIVADGNPKLMGWTARLIGSSRSELSSGRHDDA